MKRKEQQMWGIQNPANKVCEVIYSRMAARSRKASYYGPNFRVVRVAVRVLPERKR